MVLIAMKELRGLEAEYVNIHSESQMVVNQRNGTFEGKEEKMKKY